MSKVDRKLATVIGVIYFFALLGGATALGISGGEFGMFPEGMMYGAGLALGGLFVYAAVTTVASASNDGPLGILKAILAILSAIPCFWL